MATYLSTDLTGLANQVNVPVGFRPNASVIGARTKDFRAVFTFASQATSDVLQLFTVPVGAVFIQGIAYVDTSTSSATVAIGNASATGKYRAAAAITTTNAPVYFGITAAAASAPSTSEEIVIATIAAAALPSSGTMVIHMQFAMPN